MASQFYRIWQLFQHANHNELNLLQKNFGTEFAIDTIQNLLKRKFL